MQTKERQVRFHRFCQLVHLFVDVNLIQVGRDLVPAEYPDQDLVPAGIRRSCEEVLLGGVLFQCPAGTVSEIVTPFAACLAAAELPGGDGYAVLGPYLPDAAPLGDTVDRMLVENGIALSCRTEYQRYLESLPTVGQAQLMVILGGLLTELYGADAAPAPVPQQIRLSAAAPGPCPVREEDALQARAEAIRQRYAREQEFLDAVARGDDSAVDALALFRLERLPNRLRNQKNLMIALNTLLRKAVEQARVHPYYIDALSGKWAVRIENARTVAQLDDAFYAITRDYCALVRQHALGHYSPHVRAAIQCIQFNLDNPVLSLSFLAGQGGINASYLSHQFNREVGVSVPVYIARLRVDKAKQLLRGPRPLSVGQVAAAVGIPDVNYFSKTFKRIAGCTPSAFRS